MAWQCKYFTPDYPGWVRHVVEQQLGGICLFLQGAAGNITPIQGFTGDLKIYRRLGGILGLEASKIATGIETLRRRARVVDVLQSGAAIAIYEDGVAEGEDPVLRVRSRTLKVPLREFASPQESEAEAERLRKE